MLYINPTLINIYRIPQTWSAYYSDSHSSSLLPPPKDHHCFLSVKIRFQQKKRKKITKFSKESEIYPVFQTSLLLRKAYNIISL